MSHLSRLWLVIICGAGLVPWLLNDPLTVGAQSPAGCINTNLAWLEASQILLFEALNGDEGQIYRYDAQTRLLAPFTAGYAPLWSKNGVQWLYHTGFDPESHVVLYPAMDAAPIHLAGVSAQFAPIPTADFSWLVLGIGWGLGLLGWRLGQGWQRWVIGFWLGFGLVMLALRLVFPQTPPDAVFYWTPSATSDASWALVRHDPMSPEIVAPASDLASDTPLPYAVALGTFSVVFATEQRVYQNHVMSQRIEPLFDLEFVDRLQWTPDGKTLLLEARNKIYRWDGMRLQQWVEGFAGAWSDAYQQLVFAKSDGLLRLDVATETITPVVEIPGRTRSVRWHGDWILFEQNGRTDIREIQINMDRTRYDFLMWTEIYRVRADGTQLEKLVSRDENLCPLETGYMARE